MGNRKHPNPAKPKKDRPSAPAKGHAEPEAFVLRADPDPTVDPADVHIELAQLLKAVGACDTGGAAKHVVQSGAVHVNDAVELRRGRKLVPNDVVAYHTKRWKIVAPPPK